MSQNERFVRRNKVDERWALIIAAVGGLVAVLAGARPTGLAVWDAILTFSAVAAVVWASASAPWWAPAAAAGVGAVIALEPVVAAIGAVGFVAGLLVGIKRRDQSELRALVGAIAMNVLIRSELDGFLGLSALIGVSVGVALFVLGVRRRPSSLRRIAWIASGGLAGIVALALAALAVTGISARPDLTQGANSANQAISVLNQGDYERAASLFQTSADAFGRADNRLGGFLALPSRLVPMVSQNVGVGGDLASVAASSTRDAADALRAIDPSTLQVVDGRIDLDAIASVQAPLEQVQGALDELDAVSSSASSPWLVGRLQTEIDDLERRVSENQPRLDNAIDAVRLAPQLLGADAPRRYLVMFTTPVEARGLAGFVGNYAVVTADDGALDVTDFARVSDLPSFIADNPATCTDCPPEFLDRYARFGFAGADANGGVGPAAWSSITLPAHFPYVGEVSQILFPQSGGDPIDGVISMDPYVIQALMQYTGAVELPELGITVSADNAARFILSEQYSGLGIDDSTGNDLRVDALETIATQVIEDLLSGSLPPPSTLARDLGPLVSEQRLLFWSDNPAEQDLFGRIRLLGAMPELGDDGGFGLMVSNAGQSKIDLYLERSVDVRIDTADDGSRTLVADVTLTNTAPASGLPRYVIGNSYGFPTGTSYLWVNFYGNDALAGATRNGEPVELEVSTEAGWYAYERYEALKSGQSVSYQLEFTLGPPSDETEQPVIWTQPLADRVP